MNATTPSNKLSAHAAVLATNLAFAANFSFVKMISPRPVAPLAINMLRVGFSLLLFWLLWLAAKEKQGIRREHIGRFVLCGLTGVAINQMAFIKGLTLTSTVHAALLGLATPLIITLFAVWILKEKLTLAKGSGLLLGIGGAVLLIASKTGTGAGSNPLLGDALVLLNAVSYAAYFILVKPLMQTYSALHVMRWMFTFGLLFILPFAWADTAAIGWEELSPGGFGALAFIVVAGTFMAYVFNAYGIRQLGAATTGSYIYTQPVFAVLLASFFLAETISLDKVLAAVLIFTGVYLVGRK
ncbi:DMT family transporter [Pseudocnuella soli]|uniref:DMT family transporter n=1 Tax=Pseudocnuella soli TaxID=2502779 RepID=UPI00140464AD|nr:DMT family transporter [Pseudocnuella soli]